MAFSFFLCCYDQKQKQAEQPESQTDTNFILVTHELYATFGLTLY